MGLCGLYKFLTQYVPYCYEISRYVIPFRNINFVSLGYCCWILSDRCTSETGSVKTELAELEGGLGFMEDSCGQLNALVTLPESQEKACVETIAFSSFNPVPGYRR